MFVRELELHNFRNYEQLSLSFAPAKNILCGANAQGKTNLLESVYVCSCARSHRTGKDGELIRSGSSFYDIILRYTADNGSEGEIRVCYREEAFGPRSSFGGGETRKERRLYHDGLQLERIADLFGLFHAVIFAPEDLMLIKEGPAGRRRFIDLLVSQLSPSYFKELQLYQRILQQRNRMLKQLRDDSKNSFYDELDRKLRRAGLAVWNEKMAECGARIIKARQRFIHRIEEAAAKALLDISDGRETLRLAYKGPTGVSPDEDIPLIQKQFLERIERYEDDDMSKGSSSQGPHRDDIEIFLNELPVKTYASQGQQRSVVLALKMAELRVIEQECGEKPVLLLDDVMSELDGTRRRSLMAAIDRHQVFITCTDLNQVVLEEEDRRASRYFAVEAASVSQVNQDEEISFTLSGHPASND